CGGFAVRGVDQLKCADLDAVLGRNRPDLRRWSDKYGLDDACLGGIDRAAQRAFIAWMHDDGRRRRNRFGCCNETIVFRTGLGFARFDGCNAHIQLSDQLATAYDAFARDLPARPNNSVTRSSRLPASPDTSALADSTLRIASRPARRASSAGGSNLGMAARLASGSSSSMKNCSRTIFLNCASVRRDPASFARTRRNASRLRSSTMPRELPTWSRPRMTHSLRPPLPTCDLSSAIRASS